MIWFIIGFITSIVIIIYTFCDDCLYLSDKFLFSFLRLATLFVIGTITMIVVSAVINYCAEYNYNIVSDTKIIALKDNQNTNGNFYVMSGYVNEELYYYYATETELGFSIKKIDADNAYIKYANEEPHIEKYAGEFKNNIANIFGFPMCDDRYIIYCPENTIANEFKIDLE